MRAWFLLFLLAVPASASVTESFETVDVAEGVVAFIAAESRGNLVNSNCVAIIGDDGVVVVDSGQIPTLTRRMLAQIRARTDKPVRYVVNTHWHWDHALANVVYEEAFPGVRIVSTPFTRDYLVQYTPKFQDFLKTRGDAMMESFRKRRDSAANDTERENAADDVADLGEGLTFMRDTKFVPPNETFEKGITIHLGRREVRVFHPGPANTAGDAVVYVPDAKVLVTGDIVVSPVPFATGAHLGDWIPVLRSLSQMDAVAIVPGHGPVQRDRSYLFALAELFQSVKTQVDAAVAQGLTLEETQKHVDLEPFRKRFAGEDRRRNRAFRDFFAVSVVRNAWKQARGEKTSEAPF